MKLIQKIMQEIGVVLRRGRRMLPHALTVLVVPGDTDFPTGSRGDQAMLAALAKEMRRRHPHVTLEILTQGRSIGEKEVAAMGFKPVGAWNCENDSLTMRKIIARTDILMFLGADVMDGCYAHESSVKRWKLAELAQKSGVRSVVLGFSFNDSPHSSVVETINALDLDFRLNLRDEVSLARFQALRPGKGQLVADVAFLMEVEKNCGDEISHALTWVDGHRASGREVFGFNISPHLFTTSQGPENQASLSSLVRILAPMLENLILTRRCCVVLLPHDFRPSAKDNWCLDLVCDKLSFKARQSILRIEEEPTAGELKRLVSTLDLLITGRMHLAVAAMGVGVPVGCIIYQGKFEGLMRHFGLNETFIITPEEACQIPNLEQLFDNVYGKQAWIRAQIALHLREVMGMAKSNFD